MLFRRRRSQPADTAPTIVRLRLLYETLGLYVLMSARSVRCSHKSSHSRPRQEFAPTPPRTVSDASERRLAWRSPKERLKVLMSGTGRRQQDAARTWICEVSSRCHAMCRCGVQCRKRSDDSPPRCRATQGPTLPEVISVAAPQVLLREWSTRQRRVYSIASRQGNSPARTKLAARTACRVLSCCSRTAAQCAMLLHLANILRQILSLPCRTLRSVSPQTSAILDMPGVMQCAHKFRSHESHARLYIRCTTSTKGKAER